MRRPRPIACRTAAVSIALLASVLLPSTAFAQAPPAQAGDSARTVAQVADYWSPERMARAKPLGLPSAGPEAPQASVRGAGGQPVTQSGSTVSYSSFELTDTLSYPNRVQGKVFFTKPGGGNFVCSGTVVDAGNSSTVITAGHCVHQAGSWSSNFAFAPGYRRLNGSGNAPYGIWPASDEAAPQPWVDSENLKYDVGAAVIARNTAGQTLQGAVGARPIAFNQPTAQNYRSYGYPAVPTSAHPWDGTRLWACDSNPPIADSPSTAAGPNTLGIGCDMTGGASGGGWVTSSGGGSLNGVNSYKYSSQPDLMYGPYFGSSIKALYDFAAAEPPGTPRSYGAGNSIPAVDALNPIPRLAACKKAKKKVKRRRACKAQRPSAHRR
ncbi:MAG: trypsin-like serine peptidase [Solirubrobacterales bacterium]